MEPGPARPPTRRSFTVRSVKLPRRLRNFACPETPWGSAVDRPSGFTQRGDQSFLHRCLFEEEVHTSDGVDNTTERKRKKLREEQTQEAGGGYVATALQRFTVRSVKFVRWLRNFVYREVAWCDAIARLRKIYATR